MEFEPKQLRPTYSLLNGVPGQSYALELATRLGFEPSILKSALAYHGAEAQKLENLLADLQRRRAEMAEELEGSRKLNLKLEQELGALRDERKSIEELRGTLVDSYRTKLQKRLNAFENRLEIRERQFERHKEEQVREAREATEAATARLRASVALQANQNNSSLSPAGNVPDKGSAVNSPQSQNSSENSQIYNPHNYSSRNSKPRDSADSASVSSQNKPKSVTDFSALANFAFPTRPGQTNVPAAKSMLDDQAKRFRPPAKMTPRDLLDEARESLETLGTSFDSIEQDFDEDIEELAQLENKTSTRVAKTKADVQKARTPPSTKPERPASFWQPKMRVKAPKWREVGEVLRSADSKGMVECQFGLIKAKVPHSDLLTLQDAAQKTNTPLQSTIRTPSRGHVAPQFVPTPKLAPPPPPHPKPSGPTKNTHGFQAQGGSAGGKESGKGGAKNSREKNPMDMSIEPAFPHCGNSVDLRGKLVDSALERLEQYLDKAWREDINPIVVVHGHGTGRVKTAVREFLAGVGYKLKYRPGSSGEGGDGATVVVFL